MCVLNRSQAVQKFEFKWKNEIVLDSFSGKELQIDKNIYALKNLWTGKDLGMTQKNLKADVPGHDMLMLRLSKM
ncbi:MAG: hypothetical protein A2Y94_09790 [Caldithrix sp. RBG_13_44_9]|nr:MAG: hypothetical protein A2Y94_09790 [Caldithrix sp. RBG_13_44_9]